MTFAVVVPWHSHKQIREFLEAWGIKANVHPEYLFLQQDTEKEGCARTKNKGIKRALDSGADYIIVLDDDCYPAPGPLGQPRAIYTLSDFAHEHVKALQPQQVRKVFPTMFPNPRGMPYRNLTVKLRVAASIGLWLHHPDLDALHSLVVGNPPPDFKFIRQCVHGDYFPFSGMNFAFHRDWAECAVLVDVPRFDDIWMGWIWEKIAYERDFCFNLMGPLVNHVRQSNVWKNLDDEVKYLAVNDSLWSAIYSAPKGLTAETLRRMFLSSPQTVAAPAAPASEASDPGPALAVVKSVAPLPSAEAERPPSLLLHPSPDGTSVE